MTAVVESAKGGTGRTRIAVSLVLLLELSAVKGVQGATILQPEEGISAGASCRKTSACSSSPAVPRAPEKNRETGTRKRDALANQDELSRSDEIMSDAAVRRCFHRLWKRSGAGMRLVERATWIIRRGNALECVFWPLTLPEIHEANWRGAIPADTVGLAHTHPRTVRPAPSPADVRAAERLGMPVYAISRGGIWKVSGSTGETILMVGPEEWKPFSPSLEADE